VDPRIKSTAIAYRGEAGRALRSLILSISPHSSRKGLRRPGCSRHLLQRSWWYSSRRYLSTKSEERLRSSPSNRTAHSPQLGFSSPCISLGKCQGQVESKIWVRKSQGCGDKGDRTTRGAGQRAVGTFGLADQFLDSNYVVPINFGTPPQQLVLSQTPEVRE